MGRQKINKWGDVFISSQGGLWKKKGGITKIEKNPDPELVSGWWVSTPKDGFINVFNTLKDALLLRWD